MTQDLERILDGGVRQVLTDAVANRPYSHCQFVSQAVAAVVTVEDDIRFLPDTLAAVLEQTVLPGVIVVADCSGQTMQSMETTFDVVTTSSEPLEYVPQAQTVSVQIVNTRGARSFGDAVQKAIGLARIAPEVKNLWLLPSSIDLVAADTELPKLENAHHVMKRIVDAVRERFDYIFIDCSPSLGYTTVNILTAADTVLIPVQCEYLALEGLSKLLNTIRKVKSGLNPALDIEGFLLTMYMRNRLNNQVVNEVREHFGPLAYDTIIQRNIRLGEAPSHGKPVMLYDAGAVGSENYLTLAREFLKRNRKPRK